ncbi:MAG: branched-chain-amino-acid transaminase, partial [Clostridia bacterium]|nr:branched-chain-amino-acid transaminase [Clostridia bacterium]
LRPFLIGNDETLGVHAVHHATFIIIASPVGSYYKEGINPVKIMIEGEDVRAVKGGTGHIKCGGNYAASTRAGDKAEKQGYSQVLWLDGVERKYIEEVGAMNVMFKINGEIVTPALTGSILPGITRKSCLEVLRDMGYPVSERRISVDELIEAAENGTLEEAWGTGTAAVVSPIGELCYKGNRYTVSGGKIGAVTQSLYDTLTGIQWGKIEDKKGWTLEI